MSRLPHSKLKKWHKKEIMRLLVMLMGYAKIGRHVFNWRSIARRMENDRTPGAVYQAYRKYLKRDWPIERMAEVVGSEFSIKALTDPYNNRRSKVRHWRTSEKRRLIFRMLKSPDLDYSHGMAAWREIAKGFPKCGAGGMAGVYRKHLSKLWPLKRIRTESAVSVKRNKGLRYDRKENNQIIEWMLNRPMAHYGNPCPASGNPEIGRGWKSMSRDLDNGRTPHALYQHYTTLLRLVWPLEDIKAEALRQKKIRVYGYMDEYLAEMKAKREAGIKEEVVETVK